MKRICMGSVATLLFAVFGAASALAQSAPPPPPVEGKNIGSPMETIGSPGVLAGDVQEEVEILRRLLDKSFTAVYGPLRSPNLPIAVFGNSTGGMSGSMPGMSSNYAVWKNIQQEAAPQTEGIYLKDYGVVYTVTLPPPPNHMLPGPTVGFVTRTPLSPWERTRKELRGEKIEDERKPAFGSPSLSEVILKVLADNGKHFTRLTDGEQITVAVTFRETGVYQPRPTSGISVPAMPGSGGLSGSRGMAPPGGANPVPAATSGGLSPFGNSYQANSYQAPTSQTEYKSSEASEDDAPWVIDIRNSLKLGDLHLKKQNTAGAIAAYNKAQEQLEMAMNARTAGPQDAKIVYLTIATLYLHLATGYRAAGDHPSARKAIHKAGELVNLAATPVNEGVTAKTPPAPPPALPGKLIVTASKKLLGEVGSGKMTFEAFSKAATVEYIKPSADKK